MTQTKNKISDTLSFEVHGDVLNEVSAGEGDWVSIEQEVIPEEQEIATQDDLRNMIAQASSGFSAHTAASSCQVSFSGENESRKAFYTLTFYVHHSADVSPEVEVTLGGEVLDVSGPFAGNMQKSASFDVDYNKTQQLGWLAMDNTFSGVWEGQVYGESAEILNNASDQPEIVHSDGFAYLVGDQVFGTFRASATAIFDTYWVTIEHKVGTKWTGGLYATAWWPAGAVREDQKSVSEELFLPSCVEDNFSICSGVIQPGISTDPLPPFFDDGGVSDSSTYFFGPMSKKVIVYINDCTGSAIKVVEEDA